MDSLLANYASSDEDDEKPQPPQNSSSSRPKSALFSTLPRPKSSADASSVRQSKPFGESLEVSTSSLFSSLPQPKTHPDLNSSSRAKSSLFSALPPPKSSSESPSLREPKALGESPVVSAEVSLSSSLPQPDAHPDPNPNLIPKKVVQFKPPTFPLPSAKPSTDYDEEDDEAQEKRRRKQSKSMAEAPSVKSFLSSMPAAKHSATLGVSGTGRRSIVDTQVQEPAPDVLEAENDSALSPNGGSVSSVSYGSIRRQSEGNYEQGTAYGSYDSGVDYNAGNYGIYHVGTDPSSGNVSYEGYYGQYENNGVDGSGHALPESSSTVEVPVEMPRKRRRNDMPTEILEVKQDDLMKNRPREDQVKLTGIAFGPAFQPASTKGKPSKLHKRKHQIGSLYFDMKQKETELAERRSRGFLTKAQTQAKYGW